MKSLLRSSFALLLLLLVQCKENTSQKQLSKMIDIQGHRGCRGLFPENSMIGFEKAIELGVHTLELDVVISKDKKVVVSHEPFMNHEITLDVQGNPISKNDELNYNLYQMSHDSIRQYDCGSKHHPRFPNQEKVKVSKPLLSEVIQMAEAKTDKTIRYNIEIKRTPSNDEIFTPKVAEFVRLVIYVIQKHDLNNRVNLQAFDLETLEEIKKQAPSIKIALLVDGGESIDEKLQQLSFSPEIISPYYKLLTQENIENYKKKRFLIIPWTVNKKSDMLQLIDWNVDGIITDYPNLITNP